MADLPSLYIPNASDYIDAFTAGQKAGMTQRRTQALQAAGQLMTRGDYTGAADAVLPVDIGAGVELQKYGAEQNILQRQVSFRNALANHDIATARELSAGDPELTKDLGDYMTSTASTLASYVAPLKDIKDPTERAQAYQTQILPKLHQQGFSGPGYDDWQPTDQNIDQITTTAVGLSKMMDLNKPVTVGDHLVNPHTGTSVYDAPKVMTVNNTAGGQDVVSVPTGQGSPGGATPAVTTGGAPETPAPTAPIPTGGVYAQVGQIAAQNGANPGEVSYLQRLAQVESHGNPQAQNGSSTGLFQFHPDTFAGVGGGDINSVADQTKGALTLSRQDRTRLQQRGIDPTDENAYLMHQQGAAGGLALLSAPPDTNAVAALSSVYGASKKGQALARQAIVNNGGDENMTAGQFVQMWHDRWNNGGAPVDKAAPAAGGKAGPTVAPGVQVLYSTDQSDATLSDDAIKMLAGMYLKTGQMPALGMRSTAARQKILNEATRQAKDLGLNPGDIVAGTTDTKAQAKALSDNETQLNRVTGFEQTALKNADLALSLAPAGAAPGKMPILNRWIQYGRKQIAGDPDVAKFDLALGTFADEYAKVVAGQNGATDSVRAEAYHRINGAMNLDQLTQVIATMKKEMANRTDSMTAVSEGIRNRIRSGGAQQIVTTPGVPAPGASAPSDRAPINSFFRH